MGSGYENGGRDKGSEELLVSPDSKGIHMIKGRLAIAIASMVLLILTPAFSRANETPPLEPLRIGGEVLGGSVGFGIADIIGMASIYGLRSQGERRNNVQTTSGEITGAAFAHVLVIGLTSTGVWLAGSVGDQTGSYWQTLLFTALGTVPSFYVWATEPGSFGMFDDGASKGRVYATIPWPLIGAVIGFNLGRRYDRSKTTSNSALLNIASKGGVIGIPSTELKRLQTGEMGILIPLLGSNF